VAVTAAQVVPDLPTTAEAPPTTTVAVTPPSTARSRPLPRRGEPRGDTPSASEPTETSTQPPAPSTPEPAAQATGRLQLDAAPYAVVFLGARRLGITPIDVELPAGAHTLTLRNPEQQIETTYRVTIGADQVVSRRVALE
jgi:serine/threonine-protein kinase